MTLTPGECRGEREARRTRRRPSQLRGHRHCSRDWSRPWAGSIASRTRAPAAGSAWPGRAWPSRSTLGESIAVNGCCLTVVSTEGATFDVQAGPETLLRTNLGSKAAGDVVNLERSLRVGDRLGGHFVQGHVDTTAALVERRPDGEWDFLAFALDPAWTPLMVPKGSIAVDGVSLTLVDVDPDRFSIMLIPHTLAVTTLGTLKPGDLVNIETDMLAKHVAKAAGEGGSVRLPRFSHAAPMISAPSARAGPRPPRSGGVRPPGDDDPPGRRRARRSMAGRLLAGQGRASTPECALPLAFSPDGRTFLTSAGAGLLVGRRLGPAGRDLAAQGARDPEMGAFSPDGKTFAAAIFAYPGPLSIVLFDAATGRTRATLTTLAGPSCTWHSPRRPDAPRLPGRRPAVPGGLELEPRMRK